MTELPNGDTDQRHDAALLAVLEHELDAALGARAMAAVAAIGRRLDLDYGGIDFALLPDGRIFVFEANATMLVHGERKNGPLAHKNPYVQHIVDAVERLLARAAPRS